MQLVIHSPYGARINRAWGLALRKSFCRTFDFELQASADDNGIVLSLGVQHSFPLEQMFMLLKPEKARAVLIQALLAAPMFQVRWRWNVTRSLAVLRARGGKKVPPPLQRFRSDDLLTAVFPLQTACFEHRPPEVPVPDHPLVAQTVHDCLTEAMDVVRWEALLREIEAGRVKLSARDTREPSPFSHSILNAQPYAFLDDAPLEERRARAVAARRTYSPDDVRDLAKLDADAIARVREDAWPLVRNHEELHDALVALGVFAESEGERADWAPHFAALARASRAGRLVREGLPTLWVAVERWTAAIAVFPDAKAEPAPRLNEELSKPVESVDAVSSFIRGRLEITGPITAAKLARDLGLREPQVEAALGSLEAEGFAIQGKFETQETEWCSRRLLARIHRLTLEGARKRVQAVPPESYWRFLCEHHHALPEERRDGRLGLHEAVGQLQGFEAAAAAWETDLLPSRVAKYQPEWLDTLSFSGELSWGRLRAPRRADNGERLMPASGLTRVAPIAMAFRDDLGWMLPPERLAAGAASPEGARPEALKVYEALKKEGALFFDGLVEVTGLLPEQVKDALSELAALGAVTSDGFSALRGLVLARRPIANRRISRWGPPRSGVGRAGRWTTFPGRVAAAKPEDRLQHWAWQLLRRYGVLFRDLLTRENAAPSWWELVPVLRRLEARGEVRGGRFVSGVAGEQYALPEAVEALRRPRDGQSRWAVVSASDPLNLEGIISESARVPATRGNRLLYRDGRAVAVLQAGTVDFRGELPPQARELAARALKLQVISLRDGVLAQLAEAAAAKA